MDEFERVLIEVYLLKLTLGSSESPLVVGSSFKVHTSSVLPREPPELRDAWEPK